MFARVYHINTNRYSHVTTRVLAQRIRTTPSSPSAAVRMPSPPRSPWIWWAGQSKKSSNSIESRRGGSASPPDAVWLGGLKRCQRRQQLGTHDDRTVSRSIERAHPAWGRAGALGRGTAAARWCAGDRSRLGTEAGAAAASGVLADERQRGRRRLARFWPDLAHGILRHLALVGFAHVPLPLVCAGEEERSHFWLCCCPWFRRNWIWITCLLGKKEFWPALASPLPKADLTACARRMGRRDVRFYPTHFAAAAAAAACPAGKRRCHRKALNLTCLTPLFVCVDR
jgi:hypothetical protein